MEKLVELLNDYELEKVENTEGLDVSRVWIMDGTLHYYNNYKDELVFDNIDLLIISARYGFIERLVKNDKIDLDKCGRCYEINSTYDHYNLEDKQDLWLIMLLSVSDTPIEDLVSYLK